MNNIKKGIAALAITVASIGGGMVAGDVLGTPAYAAETTATTAVADAAETTDTTAAPALTDDAERPDC